MRTRAGSWLIAASLALLAAPAAAGAAATDWKTYGFSASRVGVNPAESRIGPAQAKALKPRWSVHLGGGQVDAQPLFAHALALPGGRTANVVYAGSEHGRFVALDAADGKLLWSRDLGAFNSAQCYFTYGVTDTPVLDRSRGSVYVVGGTGTLFELDLATGATKHQWPITADPAHEHVWSALTLVHGKLYVPVGGTCDIRPYRGRVVEIDTATSKRVRTWYVTGPKGPDGGGIWAWGGVSADPAANALFTATGNSFGPTEDAAAAEHVVRLDSDLHVKAKHHPRLGGFDADFGATPLPYRAKGCPRQLAVGNKYGGFFVYERDRIGNGPVQRIELGGSGDGGHALLGVAAFWHAKRMLYVSNPLARGAYRPGLLAFRVTSSCRLALAWQQEGPALLKSSPTVAGGVVYYATGGGRKVVAFDAVSGKRLWNSGNTIGNAVLNAPAVVGGSLYVGSWDGKLYAFR